MFNIENYLNRPQQENQQENKQENQKKNKKSEKSYTHGINVIMREGMHKGFLGNVSEFFPASYNLSVSGYKFVDADKYGPILPIGTKLITEFGESRIERIMIASQNKSIVKIAIYKEENILKVGILLDDLTNENDVSIMELNTFDTDLIINMNKLEMNDDDNIIRQMSGLSIENVNEVEIMEKLSNELKENESLLYTMKNYKNIYNKNDDNNALSKMFDILKSKLPSIIKISRKNIINNYYVSFDKENMGKFTNYNPSKNQYYISYVQVITFKPSMIDIKSDKRTASVKKGIYSNQIYNIESYNKAYLSIILSTDGQKIKQTTVRNKNDGKFKTRPIYQSDVFYIDLTLTNGNKAQVTKVYNNDIEIIEKIKNLYVARTIKKSEILTFEPGFSFEDVSTKIKDDYTSKYTNDKKELLEDEKESRDDEENDDEKEFDYGSELEIDLDNLDDNINGDEQKISFKDTQRTAYERPDLTADEKRYKLKIEKILKIMSISDDTIDIYETINIIVKIIPIIENKSNMQRDINVTNDINFIYICVILYALIKQGYCKPIDTIITKLYPKYLTNKDVSASSIKNTIFLKEWSILDETIIKQSNNDIKNSIANKKYTNVFKILLLNCDKVLQNILNYKVNIDCKTSLSIIPYEPLGINKLTGRRIKDEEEEMALLSNKNTIAISIKNLINGKIPKNEVPIIWGGVSLMVLDKYKKVLDTKYIESNNKNYLYIKNNLHRGLFFIKDDMPENVRKMLESTYRKMIGTIIEEEIKEKRLTSNKRKNDEQITENRKKIYKAEDLFGEENDEESDVVVKNTRKYERERKIREMSNSIKKLTMEANRNAYQDKKNREKEQMDTSE
jgi:hypothetical protein